MIQRQIFIYCYENERNYWLSRSNAIMGFKNGNDFLPNKIKRVKEGDIILIRDSTISDRLELFGGCIAKGKAYEHKAGVKYNYSDLIWDEETTFNKIVYSLRLPVDFVSIYLKKSIDWNEFLKMKQLDSDGLEMDIKQIKVFTKGNFYHPSYNESIIKLFGIQIRNPILY